MQILTFARRRFGLIAIGLALLGPLGWIGKTFVEDDNFRVTSPTLFRAGQLRPAEWTESFDASRYRSVLNLRGAKPWASWYRHELEFSAAHGLPHYDFAMSANKSPSVADMKQLVTLMRNAPKPLLVHCKNGSDRSGLAAALYLLVIENQPAEVAAGQLSLWYGHFPWLTSRTGAMDRALAEFVVVSTAEAKASADSAKLE